MKPRIMPIEDLMVELEGEHDEVCYELNKVEKEIENFDYTDGELEIKRLKQILSQHTIDEQRSLLGYLIQKLGRDNANTQINVMRGHTQIINLLGELERYIVGGKEVKIADIENLKLRLREQFAEEQTLFRQVLSIMESEHNEKYDNEVDRYINEGGK